MRRYAAVFLLILLGVLTACSREIRQPAVAGAFYPSDPATLSRDVDGFLAQASKLNADGELIAIVAPHAGYEYSGGVAGYSFKQVQGASYDTVIVIGPTHYYPFRGASVYAGDGFMTPLGNVPVDKAMARSFMDEKNLVGSDPQAHVREHSIEVELPFLQKALGRFKIVPIVVGDPTTEMLESLSNSIVKALNNKEKRVLVVVSTDWSHYHDYDTAVRMDTLGIETVKKLSSFEILGRSQMGEIELCGVYPMALAMDVFNKLGADNAVLYKYANTGDVTGDKSRVVGYAAMGIYRAGRSTGDTLNRQEQDRLISIAKDTVTDYVTSGKAPDFKEDAPALTASFGAFVTLKENGELRGCIGDFYTDGPLYMTVRDMAINAAVHDSRFRPVAKEELGGLKVEISVLSPLRKISSLNEITVGKHGLYIIKGRSAGVLLPQVPVEFKWDRETFLAQTCIKAGLPPDAWKQGADIYVFTAQVFGER